MPIVYQKEVSAGVSLVVWEITESVEELFSQLDANDRESISDHLLEKKKLETLAARVVIKHLVGCHGSEYQGIYKDDHRKPHLVNLDTHISISHAYPYAAAIIDAHSPTGLDIESPREQIHRIKHKFLSPEDLRSEYDTNDLTKLWCAKESLYKIHGRRSLIFSRDLRVEVKDQERLLGRICQGEEDSLYLLNVLEINSYWLVYKEKGPL